MKVAPIFDFNFFDEKKKTSLHSPLMHIKMISFVGCYLHLIVSIVFF